MPPATIAEGAGEGSVPIMVYEDENGMVVDAPLPPERFLCADGRRASSSAFISGVYLTVDDRPQVFVRQTDNTDEGFVHEGEGYGWVLGDGRARLVDLASGERIGPEGGVACEQVVE